MGFLFSKIVDLFARSTNNYRIVILGLQNAGKTTILYRLSLGQFVNTQPTIGSNVEEISYNNVKFQTWDLGGQQHMRTVWDAYYQNTNGIIYVIDSSDFKNLDDSKKEFTQLLEHNELKNAVILIYANKQDLPDVKKIGDLIDIYGLDKVSTHTWHIQPCSATTGEGLFEGLKWLSDQLIYKNTRFPVNPYQVDLDISRYEEESVHMNQSILNNSANEELTKHYMDDLDTSEIVNENLNLSK